MNESALVNITINNRKLQARAGQTVLQAAAEAGIEIPALCNHPHLKPEGSCRVCLVEIEKQRTLQPACTFPVAEGMVVQTETPKVADARKFALQMIFSERSHYCMICPQSGTEQTTDCELQKLGYRHGLTSWAFPPDYAKPWPIDASRKHFVMDHSRCILCRRCVRACSQVAANHTLGLAQRGAKTMISADDNVPFGQSTCVSCGTCLQVCPTGALTDRRSAYAGHDAQVRRTPAVCMGCAAGCSVEALVRDNQLLRVEGDWNGPNGGLLCSTGRFEALEPRPPRILWPMVRVDGKLVQTSWDKALTLVATRFAELRRVAGLASPRLTNEAFTAFACFFHEVVESNDLALLYGDVPPMDLGRGASMADLAAADCVVVIGGDPLRDQKVLGALVKRGHDNGATLVIVSDISTSLDPYAKKHIPLEDIQQSGEGPFERLRTVYHLRASGLAQLKSIIDAHQRPVILYASGLTTTVYAALRALPAKVRFMPLVQGTNAAGAARIGLRNRPVRGEALYVLAGDDQPNGFALPQRQFTVVQAAYPSAWTDSADVVLPSQTWAEQKGHIVNLEGRVLPVMPLLQAPRSVHADWETLLQLSVRMGSSLSFDQISDISRVN